MCGEGNASIGTGFVQIPIAIPICNLLGICTERHHLFLIYLKRLQPQTCKQWSKNILIKTIMDTTFLNVPNVLRVGLSGQWKQENELETPDVGLDFRKSTKKH